VSVTVAEALRGSRGEARLAVTSDTARLDAELLMAHALGVPLGPAAAPHARCRAPFLSPRFLDRRADHEPVAYITGRQELLRAVAAVDRHGS
jgi:release factor glutamine methyltransferase